MKSNSKGLLSITLTLAVVNAFTLGTSAYSPVPSSVTSPRAAITQQQPGASGNTGLLNCRGQVTINGNEAKSGSTVVSGNIVGTGNGSYASIEMGPPLGRIELKSDTTVGATFAPGLIMDDLIRCGHMTETVPTGVTVVVRDKSDDTAKVICKAGQLLVKYDGGKEKTLNGGDAKTFDRLEEVDTTGACIFTIECGHHIAGLYWWLGAGLLGLVGVGVGLGVTTFSGGNGNNGSTPVLSGAIP
jgi:hypothetical protein